MKRGITNLPDTNVILRYLLRDHEEMYDRAAEFFDSVKRGEVRALVLESVLVECIYVLTKFYEVPREKTAAALQELLRYRGIVNDDREQLIRALGLYAQTSVDPVDCVLYVKSIPENREPFSFDSDLDRLAGRK